MSTATLVAGTVMNQVAAALLNDAAKSIYTFAVQIPHLNMALQELQEYFELNEVPVVDTVSGVMTVPAGVDHIAFLPKGQAALPNTPYLPENLVEPQWLWERQLNTNPYTPMTKLDVLPRYMEGTELSQFLYYTWQAQELRFLPTNQVNQIKMDYIRSLFAPVVNEDSEINIVNAASFLEYRTGGLCAEFIGENKSRADDLNGFASLAMDRVVGIGTKGRQMIFTRRRPFRNSYKRRTYM